MAVINIEIAVTRCKKCGGVVLPGFLINKPGMICTHCRDGEKDCD
ncbi:MAG: hypothetical protein ACLQF0_06745 [Dissulfurispiraceae bacterium]